MEENIDIHNLIGRIVDFEYLDTSSSKKELCRGVVVDIEDVVHKYSSNNHSYKISIYCPVLKKSIKLMRSRHLLKNYEENFTYIPNYGIVKIHNELML